MGMGNWADKISAHGDHNHGSRDVDMPLMGVSTRNYSYCPDVTTSSERSPPLLIPLLGAKRVRFAYSKRTAKELLVHAQGTNWCHLCDFRLMECPLALATSLSASRIGSAHRGFDDLKLQHSRCDRL